jgi:hypothetical protein
MSFKAIDDSSSRLAVVARTCTDGEIVYGAARSPVSLARCIDVIKLSGTNVIRLCRAKDYD